MKTTDLVLNYTDRGYSKIMLYDLDLTAAAMLEDMDFSDEFFYAERNEFYVEMVDGQPWVTLFEWPDYYDTPHDGLIAQSNVAVAPEMIRDFVHDALDRHIDVYVRHVLSSSLFASSTKVRVRLGSASWLAALHILHWMERDSTVVLDDADYADKADVEFTEAAEQLFDDPDVVAVFGERDDDAVVQAIAGYLQYVNQWLFDADEYKYLVRAGELPAHIA